MEAVVDQDLHSRHCRALAHQLVKETVTALEQHGIFDVQRKRDLAKDILFGICAVLDGSAHGGELDGEPISPFLGFYVGADTETPLVPENGSATHEYILELIDGHPSFALDAT